MSTGRRRRRTALLHEMISRRQGPMFPGNLVAQEARDTSLQIVMDMIDSQEIDGFLPRGTIQRVVEEQQVVYPWLTRYQIDGLRKRRTSIMRKERQQQQQLLEHGQEENDRNDSDFNSIDSDRTYDARADPVGDDDDNQEFDADAVGDAMEVLYPSVVIPRNTVRLDSVSYPTSVGRKKGTTHVKLN